MAIAALSGWTREQKSVVAAAYLGWMLDAFDFFLLVFVIRDIAAEFGTDIPSVAFALVLTLALRPIGAFIFGRAADRYGRRPTLIADILCYSLLAFASGFATDLTMLLVLRGLFGIAMGGEWGVGASLTMETIPPKARGIVSGILQSGYPSGYLFASIVYYFLYPYIGWRGMFMLGIAPALLTIFILRNVKESPEWKPRAISEGDMAGMLLPYIRLVLYALLLWPATALHAEQPVIAGLAIGATLLSGIYFAWRNPALWLEFFTIVAILLVDYFAVAGYVRTEMAIIYNAAAVLAGVFLRQHWHMGIYAMLVMTAFNFFAHGTQDLYPTFLQVQQGFSPSTVGTIAVIYNIGGILGSLTFGSLSERIGRRRAIVLAALLSLPLLPLWAYAGSPFWFAIGAFLMQFMVQAAWGVIPVHLNELSPSDVRGTFPGFVYQLGNLLASVNATLQADFAVSHGNDYATALVIVAAGSAVSIALLVGFGVERKGVQLETGSTAPIAPRVTAKMTPQEQQ
jgi:MFS family permease